MSASGIDRQSHAEALKDKGNDAFKRGDYDGAVQHYTDALRLVPGNLIYSANRAMAYIKLGKYGDAIKDCDQVLDKDPSHVKALLRRGCAYAALNDNDAAKTDFQHVLQLEGNNTQALAELKAIDQKIAQSVVPKPVPMTSSSGTSSGEGASAFMELKAKRDEKQKGARVNAAPQQPTQPVSKQRSAVSSEQPQHNRSPLPPPPMNAHSQKPVITSSTMDVTKSQRNSDSTEELTNPIKHLVHGNEQTASISLTARSSTTNADQPSQKTDTNFSNQSVTPQSVVSQSKAATGSTTIQAMPPRIPTEPPKTSYELEKTWKEVSRDKDALFQYLRLIDPARLPNLMANCISEEMLAGIGLVLRDSYQTASLPVSDVLHNLTRVRRFGLVAMAAEPQTRAVYKTVLSRLKDGSCGETIATSEWEELAKLYRVA